jgi:uncharacterized protein YcfJ
VAAARATQAWHDQVMMTTLRRALLVVGLGGLFAAAPVPALCAPAASQPTTTSERLATLCSECAIVDSVKSETRKGEGGAVGMVGGAVVGGVLGHQIGGGVGKTLATVGGAAAGAYAGNQVQKNVNKTTVWTTRVTLKDGSSRSFETAANPGFKSGEVVLVDGGTLKKR